MITEALILAVGAVLVGILLKLKEIYEVWVSWAQSLRRDEHQYESTIISELKGHIHRLTADGDNLRASIAYLTHEQLECSVEEERLWGALNLIHHHVVKQNEEIKHLGATPDDTPSLPPRRIRNRMTPEEFFRRTAQTITRLEEAATTASGNSKTDLPAPPAAPPNTKPAGGAT